MGDKNYQELDTQELEMGDKNYQELDTQELEYYIDLSSGDSSERDSDTDESIPEFTALKPYDFELTIKYLGIFN